MPATPSSPGSQAASRIACAAASCRSFVSRVERHGALGGHVGARRLPPVGARAARHPGRRPGVGLRPRGCGDWRSIPRRSAVRIASVRLWTPSLSNADRRCALTVPREMSSRAAMCLLHRPSVSRVSTCPSRSVRGSAARLVASRAAIDGLRWHSPRWAVRTATKSSSADAPSNRKAAAPRFNASRICHSRSTVATIATFACGRGIFRACAVASRRVPLSKSATTTSQDRISASSGDAARTLMSLQAAKAVVRPVQHT